MDQELLRLVAVRPPSLPDSGAAVSLATKSAFQESLIPARAGSEPFAAMSAIAKTYASQNAAFVSDLSSLEYGAAFAAIRSGVLGATAAPNQVALDQLVTNALSGNAKTVTMTTAFQSEVTRVFDSIVAIFLLPRERFTSLARLAEMAQTIGLLQRLASGDPALQVSGAANAALAASILLPANLFPIHPGVVQPVGVGDLLVVRQHIQGYALGEIAQVQNILLGESRRHRTKHTLTTVQTSLTQTEKTTETQSELQTSEKFDLKNEVENTVKEDLSVKAGVSLSAKYGTTLSVNTNVNVGYEKATENSSKTATDHAKDVISRAATKVTERVLQQQTTSVTETFEEDDAHVFDNSKGGQNVVGVYQWLNKVYRAQVFNYGKRLLFDVTVSEPAAFLLDAVHIESQSDPIQPPDPFTLTPGQLSETPLDPNYYGHFLAKYNVAGVLAPPLDHISVAKTFVAKKSDDVLDGTELTIPEGYQAKSVAVQGQYNYNTSKADSGVNVFVGNVQFLFLNQDDQVQSKDLTLAEAEFIPIAIECFGVENYSFTVDIQCVRTNAAVAKWQLSTHSAIVQAYAKAFSDYQDQLAARKFENPLEGALGSTNPDRNRDTERVEIKKCCLALLLGQDLLTTAPVATGSVLMGDPPTSSNPPAFPRTNPATAMNQGRLVRFFEEAFEWDQMTYFFYPYYWARKGVWYANAVRANDDPIFQSFLNAGAARAVIPVRPSFEADLRYYLMTGEIWQGADMPSITDADYLPITDEIKESATALDDGTPVGDSWSVVLPTTLVKLRTDGKLPGWDWTAPWNWAPTPSTNLPAD